MRNPAFILELLDEVKPEVADALLDVLEPVVGSAFQDRYLQLRFDLSSVLWIVTAADPKAIPERMRPRLEVIELSGYTEQEKLHIAEQYLLKRAFEVTMPVSAGCLAPGVGSVVLDRRAGHRPGRSDRRGRARGVVDGRIWRRCRPGRRFPPPTHGRLPRRAGMSRTLLNLS